MRIRKEQPDDIGAVYSINTAAFPTAAEARLVNALRADASPVISLVAEDAGSLLGHILFSPVTLEGGAAARIMGLAPMAVVPARQCSGTGTALVAAGLEECRALEVSAVVVLGHPGYYPRFGFVPASRFGIASIYDAPDAAFMALELVPGSLSGLSGTVHYHKAFDDLT
jgi:putative acetyltransferase